MKTGRVIGYIDVRREIFMKEMDRVLHFFLYLRFILSALRDLALHGQKKFFKIQRGEITAQGARQLQLPDHGEKEILIAGGASGAQNAAVFEA